MPLLDNCPKGEVSDGRSKSREWAGFRKRHNAPLSKTGNQRFRVNDSTLPGLLEMQHSVSQDGFTWCYLGVVSPLPH